MRLGDKVGDLRAYLMVGVWCFVMHAIDFSLQTVSQKEKARKFLESQRNGIVLSSPVEGALECHTIVCLDNAHGLSLNCELYCTY
jgi:hypothetical protein